MISIIVPIYKVEPYLRRCVDSLLAQSIKDTELILVDDGSPDNCGEICEEYARTDARVRVIHKENGGLSDARNAGLAIAQGEWISYVDSDDWVSPTFLERLFASAERTGADICECGFIRTDGNDEETSVNQGPSSTSTTETMTVGTSEGLKLLIEDCVFHQTVWNKIYRRECLEGMLFPVGKTNEDEFWTYQVFGRAGKVTKIEDGLYYYFQRPGSIMGAGYSLKRLDALEAKLARQQYVEENFPELTQIAALNLFGSCIYSGQMTLKHLSGEEQKEAVRKIDSIRAECTPDKGTIAGMTGHAKMWTNLAVKDFWKLCRVKNFLGKGL
ncbi:MAG: glycosyltransferase [Lachnospiraceae bacterium]|nr:glycosyltransferase [Lachnospiraceae bacterium]